MTDVTYMLDEGIDSIFESVQRLVLDAATFGTVATSANQWRCNANQAITAVDANYSVSLARPIVASRTWDAGTLRTRLTSDTNVALLGGNYAFWSAGTNLLACDHELTVYEFKPELVEAIDEFLPQSNQSTLYNFGATVDLAKQILFYDEAVYQDEGSAIGYSGQAWSYKTRSTSQVNWDWDRFNSITFLKMAFVEFK